MTDIATARCVAERFISAEKIRAIEPRGDGLINTTFLVTTESEELPHFILQRINDRVFPRPDQIMENIQIFLRHAQQKQGGGENRSLRLPGLCRTIDGSSYCFDSAGAFWRALSFIEHTRTLRVIENLRDAEEVGYALGAFHRLVNDLDVRALHVTLPGFHVTTDYLARYRKVSKHPNSAELSADTRSLQEFIDARAGQVSVLEDAKNRGLLQIRPIHGDPKLDNVLFDVQTGRAVSMIDLDTVMPGLIHYDIGDCLRSCCNTAGEAPASAEAVDFDLDVCRVILGAYWEEAGDFLTTQDYAFVYDAIRLIPFELGLRFFTDYLERNKYFKNLAPKETLHRAKTQFKLTERIEQKEDQIRCLVAELVKI